MDQQPTTRRRTRRRALAAVALAGLGLGLAAPPAAAHVAIRLDLAAPAPGAQVTGPVEVQVIARPMLLGVPTTRFTLAMDGRPIDPVTGRPATAPTATQIRVNQTRRVPLGQLPPGRHTVTVTYRPDTDAPVMTTTTDFVVQPSPSMRWRWGIAAGVVLLAVTAAVVLRRRRTGAGKPGAPAVARPGLPG